MWDTHGMRYPVTVLQVCLACYPTFFPIQTVVVQLENCQVTANIHTVREDQTEYHAVQVAASDKSPKNVTKQMLGHFKKAGVAPKRIVKEFPVTPDAHVPVGEQHALYS